MEPVLNTPVILDLGSATRRNVRRLKAGGGRLMADVQEAIAQVTSSLGDQAQGKELLPVVVLYRKRSRRSRGGFIPICS
jgi:hypothetical protein